MRKAVVCTLIAGVTWGSGVSAYETHYLDRNPDVEHWQGGNVETSTMNSSHPMEWQGAGIGGIAGALIAGPPGFIIGAAGGVLSGRSAGLESDLHTTRQEVERLQKQQDQAALSLSELTHQLATVRTTNRQQLQAITSGFLFRIQFRSDQSLLEPHDELALKGIAESLQTLDALKVHIHAFADQRGTVQHNQQLAQARATVVTQVLTHWGVSKERLDTRIYGEQGARYALNDEEGLGYDRQVIIRFCLKEGV